MTDLLALAAECEKAEGPDRALDAKVGAAIRLCPDLDLSKLLYPDAAEFVAEEDGAIRVFAKGDDGEMRSFHKRGAPRYTASIDAALTLVPEGSVWHVMTDFGGLNRAKVGPAGRPSASVYSGGGPGDHFVTADAETPALALCAAALRARAAGHGEG